MNEIQPDLKKKLKSKARLLEPLVRIGKNGLTDNMLTHIKLMLKKRQLVKIKLLKSFVDCYATEDVAEELARKTDSVLVDKVGFNITLYRMKQREKREEAKER
ncbi:MAG: YhbY family RNA-binding protein [Nanoarchaeota archaeon]|nr:YhbY family RNA-binding protein [Nanoarchaeota archaeon]